MESKLYSALKRQTPGVDWQRHEDKLALGIPDCSYGYNGHGGWVELKTYDNWPQNVNDPLNWSDLKPEQVNWLIRRGEASGRCFILLQIGKQLNKSEFLLISHQYLRRLDEMNRGRLIQVSTFHGTSLKGILRHL